MALFHQIKLCRWGGSSFPQVSSRSNSYEDTYAYGNIKTEHLQAHFFDQQQSTISCLFWTDSVREPSAQYNFVSLADIQENDFSFNRP
jgi:hypothetical protein